MAIRWMRDSALLVVVIGSLFINGCEGPGGIEDGADLAPEIDDGTTIGSLVEVFGFDAVAVEGFSLVGGLRGTGSSECPIEIRNYIAQYILSELPGPDINVEELINSHDTAVVMVYGVMPRDASKGDRFDVLVSALSGTQTRSLDGGYLYGAELKPAGGFGITIKVPATASGPVYIDKLGQSLGNRIGYILGGGRRKEEGKVTLALRVPDYKTANLIRNRLNSRFGRDAAKALSPGQIELNIPPLYSQEKARFVSVVRAMYVRDNRQMVQQRITENVRKLAVSDRKGSSERSLEAIGNISLPKLRALLSHSEGEVRFRAARCMLNLGSDEGMLALREIAMDRASGYRVMSLEALRLRARRGDAASVARVLLRDASFRIRYAAYEQLGKLDDIAVKRSVVGRNFYLEEVIQTDKKDVYISRLDEPRIVLFGVPIKCRDDIFVQSPDGSVTINAPAGASEVSIIRRHPSRNDVSPIMARSSFDLGEIIRTLAEESIVDERSQKEPGLNLSFSEVGALLKEMCEKGAIEAEFHAGPMPTAMRIIK